MKSRYEGLQNRLWGIQESCFFLSLLSVAEERKGSKIDFIDAVNKSFEKNWIQYDYTVSDDVALLSWLTGEKVYKRISNACGVLKGNEYSICKYQLEEKKHFRRRYFDVFNNSRTVANGKLVAYYIYTFGGK